MPGIATHHNGHKIPGKTSPRVYVLCAFVRVISSPGADANVYLATDYEAQTLLCVALNIIQGVGSNGGSV